jgi:DNA-binding beta-propeller fold protein YncE
MEMEARNGSRSTTISLGRQEKEHAVKQKFAVPALGAVAFALLWGTPLTRAAEEPAQPYPPGTLLTVAGNGEDRFSGDGGPAIQAALSAPRDQVMDAAGNLYIADGDNHRVRKLSPDGTISTVAGTGQPGFSGDGGPAVKAKLAPRGVAIDPAGNLFISDTFANRVRMVSATGIITTVAGGGKPADGRGDGGPATAAAFRLSGGVAVDPLGNLYISDYLDGRVRKVSLDGSISTVAGGEQPADGVGDGSPATDARLDGPYFITRDAGGNLFIAENRGERIRKVNPAGIITTVAGNGQIGHTGDGDLATAASLNSPLSVAVDRAGNLYFSEGPRYNADGSGREKRGNNLVRKVIGVAAPG